MLGDAQAGDFDVLMVWKIDRLGRSHSLLLTVLDRLAAHGVGFASHRDADGDVYGDSSSPWPVEQCDAPIGDTADSTDCDDHDPSVHPGADDPTGDGIDKDCDGND